MNITKTALQGLLIIEPSIFLDTRGLFLEMYNKEAYKALGIPCDFIQDNLSVSKKGVIRAFHFQNEPYTQGKLVSVIQGKVFDVIVDVRVESPTFGEYVCIELSGENKKQVFIPPGFAHGFMALEDNTIFTYKCTGVYNKESEEGFLYNDTVLAVPWPEGDKIVSEKDLLVQTFQSFKEKRGL